MTDREKLTELLLEAWRTAEETCASVPCADCEGRNAHPSHCMTVLAVDHLLANGVTVQEQNGCEHCRTASYTENPFTVITQMGREVKTQFNFCPNCGRRLPQPPKGE